MHGLHAVARQVEQHLFDHGAVTQHRRTGRINFNHHRHRQLARLQADQRHHGIQQRARLDGLTGLVTPAHKVVHAFDDLAGAFCLLGDASHSQLQVAGQVLPNTDCNILFAGSRLIVQKVQRAGGITGNRSQRLVQLMTHQRGHLTNHCKSRRRLEAVLAGARQLFGTALFADIQDGAHPAGVLADSVDQRRLHDQHREARTVRPHENRLVAFAGQVIASQP